jgi:hypothetical protein
MVHGTYKFTRTALFALSLLVVRGTANAVARLRLQTGTFREKLLLFPRLILVMVLLPLLLLGRLLRLRRRLLLRLLRLHLRLRLLARLAILLARSVLAAPAPAAMPLIWRLRRLTVVRRGPHFWLGLRCFCRHACTSWFTSETLLSNFM